MIANAVFSTTIAILLISAHHLGRRFSLLFMMGVVTLFAIVCHLNLSLSFSAENSFAGSLYRFILSMVFFLCCMKFFVCALGGALETEGIENSTDNIQHRASRSLFMLLSFGVLGPPALFLFVWCSSTLFTQATVTSDSIGKYLIWAGVFLLNGAILFLSNFVITRLFARAFCG